MKKKNEGAFCCDILGTNFDSIPNERKGKKFYSKLHKRSQNGAALKCNFVMLSYKLNYGRDGEKG